MEFNFNINNYFKDEITKVGSRLIPEGFFGDKREVQDCLSKVSYILNVLGEKSAKAQGLQKVITSGEKLRNSDHVIYILIDPKGGSRGLGTVVGMLKVGVKHLYVFDAGGNSHEVTTKCVLDFYVHESKQRMGLGKKLFQHMLKEERVDPVHLAIDKPSSKFLSFLLKHYGLKTIIPQMNNFVVFDGFFMDRAYGDKSERKEKTPAATSNTVGGQYSSESSKHGESASPTVQLQSVSKTNLNHGAYYGRQAPHKPVSTMKMILQQISAPSQQPPANGSSTDEMKQTEAEVSIPKFQEILMENEQILNENEIENAETNSISKTPAETEKEQQIENSADGPFSCTDNNSETSIPITPTESQKALPETHNEKIRVNSQGYLDLKFYHSNLW